ncbi:MAG: hydroxyacid dehydrogenase [Pseudomonadota bacterium]
MKILVCDPISPRGIEILKKIPNAQVDEKPGLTEAELKKLVPEYDALLVRSGVKITEAVIKEAKKLKVVARAGTGYDNIDVEAATVRGVLVTNTPGENSIAAAELAVGLLLSLARHIPAAHASLRAGKWERKKFVGTELAGKVLGIVGLGRVGREVARRVKGLGMNAIAFDPFVLEPVLSEAGVVPVPWEDLLRRSDFISLHADLNPSTRHMVDQAAFSKMKKGVRIVNCARGGLIDEQALLEALESGRVSGAALDVFETEPPPKDLPLLKHPNVIVSPHLGASTLEAQDRVGVAAAEQIRAFLTEGRVIHPVNEPIKR